MVPAVHVGPVEHIWGSPGSLRKVPGRTQRRAVEALAELRAAVAFVRRHRLLLRVIAVETQNGSKLSKRRWASCMIGMREAAERGHQVRGPFCGATMRSLNLHWAPCMIDMSEAVECGYQVRGALCRATMRRLKFHFAATKVRPQSNASR